MIRNKLFSFITLSLAVSALSAFAQDADVARAARGGAIAPVITAQSVAATRGRGASDLPAVTASTGRTAATVARSGAATTNQTVSPRNTVSSRSAVAGTQSSGASNEISAVRGTVAQRTGAASPRADQSNRSVAARAGEITVATTSDASNVSANESCIQEYADCMDQFCNVIDQNQKRCSCSSRLSGYSRVETAVKEGNDRLNDVAQRIRYVGLSADEIRAIMNATEAEEELSGARDTTESRNLLTQIEKMMKNPEQTVAETNNSFGLDMDINFEDTTDISEMFSLSGSQSGSSFANMRGTQLYNAAANRCKNILTTCKARGANTAMVTSRYDIEVDKDCISYEQGLEKMNATLKNNVRSANQMLQKARLAVLNNQNEYDARGCVSALDSCMTDDMVCGSDYAKCMDPTKRYIDDNGQIVLGQDIAVINGFMDTFDGSNIDFAQITNAQNQTYTPQLCSTKPNNNGLCIEKYLVSKIGTGDAATSGLCRAVLDKCRRVSYDQNGRYNPSNDVVKNYLQRAMVNIKSGQEKIISDYASKCMQDIATCYSQQVTQINAWSNTADAQNVYNVMKGACRNIALTCAYAVFAHGEVDAAEQPLCPRNSKDAFVSSTTADQNTCIESVSNIFYQSMLCPDNSEYIVGDYNANMGDYAAQVFSVVSLIRAFDNSTYASRVFANSRCLCAPNMGVASGKCLSSCPTGSSFVPVKETCEGEGDEEVCKYEPDIPCTTTGEGESAVTTCGSVTSTVGCYCNPATPLWNSSTGRCDAKPTS